MVTEETQAHATDPRPPMTPETREAAIRDLLPMVRHIVLRMAIFLPSNLGSDDLVSAGVLGLVKAVDNFDPTRGASLRGYCAIRIRGAVVDELRRLSTLPRSVHREGRELMEIQEALSQKLGREPSETELGDALGIDVPALHSLLNRVRPLSFVSLSEPASPSNPDSLAQEDVLMDPRAESPADSSLRQEDRRLLLEQLRRLPKQQVQVLSLYYIEDLRLKEIAHSMGITESRVSQIHTLAISRLRAAFERARAR